MMCSRNMTLMLHMINLVSSPATLGYEISTEVYKSAENKLYYIFPSDPSDASRRNMLRIEIP